MKSFPYIKMLLYIFIIIIVAIVFEVVGLECAEEYYTNPEAIIQKVSEKGSSKIVSELLTSENKWNYVIDKISTGESNWLKVAVTLRPGTDAGATEMIFGALGNALKFNPKEVLNLVSEKFTLKHICSWPVVGEPPCTEYSLCLKEIEERQKSVIAVSDKNLITLCKQCVDSLEKGKEEIAGSYEIK